MKAVLVRFRLEVVASYVKSFMYLFILSEFDVQFRIIYTHEKTFEEHQRRNV